MKFAFNRGTWEDGNSLPEWQSSEEFQEYLARIGYISVATTFGCEDGNQIAIYESRDNDSFYASVCPLGGTVYEVFLPDFPSLMMFVKDYGVAFSAESSNYSQQQILELLEKLFQLQHGHPAYDICSKCDPAGWNERVQAREDNRKKRGTNS